MKERLFNKVKAVSVLKLLTGGSVMLMSARTSSLPSKIFFSLSGLRY